jgi:hypothetical protein
MWLRAAIAIAAAAAPARAEQPPARDFAYLAEIVCDAGQGAPLVPAVLADECPAARLRREADVVDRQRHDWPAVAEAAHRPQGYQRSISYVVRDSKGRWMAVQTFDFGGGERRFGQFDSGRGDGGQVATISGGAAHVAMTEDGSGGVQWFTGAACRAPMEPTRSGWLLFDGARGAGWRASVAELRITRGAADCPSAFDKSYTRWRETLVDWPVLFDGKRDPARPQLPQTPTIQSEHFGGLDDAAAGHMERFYLARGIGLVRWERWEQLGRSPRPSLDERAEALAVAGRCPEVAGSTAPGGSWRRIDCRTWTNFVHAPEAAARFSWPASAMEAN